MRTCHNFGCVQVCTWVWRINLFLGINSQVKFELKLGFFKVQNVKNLQIAEPSQAKIGNKKNKNNSKQTMS